MKNNGWEQCPVKLINNVEKFYLLTDLKENNLNV